MIFVIILNSFDFSYLFVIIMMIASGCHGDSFYQE